MTQHQLSGLRVLVTRPTPMGDRLCQRIDEAGGIATHFPTIQIQFIPMAQQQITALSTQDWLIFVSPQAVYATQTALLIQRQSLPKIAAIGAGTASALIAAGLAVDVYPAEQWNSEGLLALPEFQRIRDKKITLVCGEGGREYLADSLTTLGAKVSHLLTYRRCLPNVEVGRYNQLLQEQQIDIIISTSGDGLNHLHQLLSDTRENLQKIPLIVVGERQASVAKQLGFQKIIVAGDASNDTIMRVLWGSC